MHKSINRMQINKPHWIICAYCYDFSYKLLIIKWSGFLQKKFSLLSLLKIFFSTSPAICLLANRWSTMSLSSGAESLAWQPPSDSNKNKGSITTRSMSVSLKKVPSSVITSSAETVFSHEPSTNCSLNGKKWLTIPRPSLLLWRQITFTFWHQKRVPSKYHIFYSPKPSITQETTSFHSVNWPSGWANKPKSTVSISFQAHRALSCFTTKMVAWGGLPQGILAYRKRVKLRITFKEALKFWRNRQFWQRVAEAHSHKKLWASTT